MGFYFFMATLTFREILEKRKEIENEIVQILKDTKSDFTLQDVKDVIYNEEDENDMMHAIEIFDRGGGTAELSNVLELINDAWNYFPHKSLNDLSPLEKSLEYESSMKNDVLRNRTEIIKKNKKKSEKQCCGICGSSRKKLIRTKCCNNWICDDQEDYVLFSYARNSCFRNHQRYTLCAVHFNEGHQGRWQDCKKCLKMFSVEMYNWYGANEYNFERLDKLLPFTPIRCGQCGVIIFESRDDYSILPDDTYRCERFYIESAN